jgi:hypothetical protein
MNSRDAPRRAKQVAQLSLDSTHDVAEDLVTMTSEPLTMAVLVEIREQLMALWDEALTNARSTGHWDDANACGVIIDTFHKTFADALRAGKFSGDGPTVMKMWDDIHASELEYRRLAEAKARHVAPQPDPAAWWNILGVAPDATPDLRSAYMAKLKRCHPDTVAGLAPEIVALANALCQRLTDAFQMSQCR